MIGRRRPVPARPDTTAGVEAARTVLGTVDGWIRQLDVKAGATLAADGVAAGLLVSMTNHGGSWLTVALAALCGLLLVVSAVAAAMAVNPRTRPVTRIGPPSTAAVPNPLFYGDIADRWTDPATYTADLTDAVRDPTLMTRHLGQQIWVNSGIAARKAALSRAGLTALFLAVADLAALAVITTVI